MSRTLYRGAEIPENRADFANALPLARVWTDNLSVGSSGKAALRMCYGGAGPIYVLREGRVSGGRNERSYRWGTRWENLTAAAYVDQDTLTAAGSNITAAGNAHHLGKPCNFITVPAATHGYGTSYCIDGHGVAVLVGQKLFGRIDVAFSRALTGDEIFEVYTAGATNQAANRQIAAANGLQPGTWHSIMIDQLGGLIDTAGTQRLYFVLLGTFATPITVYFRRRMLFDATGLASSECVPGFVDPSIDYGFGCAGVFWKGSTCGNIVDAAGRVVEREGLTLPKPMGIQWEPAATGLATDSPPTSGVELTVTNAAAGVAGLPAKRLAATSVDASHYVGMSAATLTGRRILQALIRKPASGGAGAVLSHSNNSWAANITTNAGWTASTVRSDPSSKILDHQLQPLGGDAYLFEMSLTMAGETGPADYLFVSRQSDGALQYVGAGELLDVAAFSSYPVGHVGLPILASGGALSRIVDDPATALRAIGTGPFTAFIDFTPNTIGSSGEYPRMFSSMDDGSGVWLYSAGGAVYFYKDGTNNVDGASTIAAGTRTKMILRRDGDGVVAFFKDGIKKVTVSSTPHDSTTAPRFASTVANYTPDTVIHDQWLEYRALSDLDCARVTRV